MTTDYHIRTSVVDVNRILKGSLANVDLSEKDGEISSTWTTPSVPKMSKEEYLKKKFLAYREMMLKVYKFPTHDLDMKELRKRKYPKGYWEVRETGDPAFLDDNKTVVKRLYDEIKGEYADNISISCGRDVTFVTLTHEQATINGGRIPIDETESKAHLENMHRTFEQSGVNSWWFKEYSKAGDIHYHGVMDVYYPNMSKEMFMLRDLIEMRWEKGITNVQPAVNKRAVITYSCKELDLVVGTKFG